jgi:hypothetical protein
MAYKYLKISMEMREEDAHGPRMYRNPAPPIPAYDNWTECATLAVRYFHLI